jgi:cell wall-associated NlpC family hydrolase
VPLILSTASPTDLAKAKLLGQEIAVQSAVLDRLSDQYNRAVEQAMAASLRLKGIQDALASAQVNVANAQTRIAAAQRNLRARALDAYLNRTVLPSLHTDNVATAAYQLKIASIYSGSAMQTTAEQVQDLHNAVDRHQAAQHEVEAEMRHALVDNAAATAAEQQAQATQAEAQVAQAKLLVSLNQVQVNIGLLVDAQRAPKAQAAYTQLSQSRNLLFRPALPLPPQLPQAHQALSNALAQVGKPYVWGGAGPDVFDCSGLIQWSWGQAGVSIARVSEDQQVWSTPVPISQVQPGDLVFFGNPAHHVGMYVGSGLMVDAPHTGAVVEVVPVWWTDLAGFGRVHR